MRPLRGLVACLATLLFLTALITFRRSERNPDNPAQAEVTRRSRLRALFSFHTPDSLFPPSAIISLTDDNSTFFVARPAAYGPSLPSSGLSGQLWIGSGFGEDSAQGNVNSEGELGCSDIPGWPYTGPQGTGSNHGQTSSRVKSGLKRLTDQENVHTPTDKVAAKGPAAEIHPDAPPAKEGTDNFLHWPLKGAPLLKGVRVPVKQQDGTKDNKDPEHADIQSIQEGAEIAGKVVLLSRGGCGFLEKTKWVQARGGVALIVGNNIRDPGLVNMYASEDTSNVTIPSVFTSHMSAHLLSSLLPSGGFLADLPAPAEPPVGKAVSAPVDKSSKKAAKKVSKASTKPTSTNVPGSTPSGRSWLSRLAKALGIRSDSATPNHRFPNSGRISWVQSDNWDEDITPPRAKTAASQKKISQPDNQGPGGFVIGVHDWRDPDLVGQEGRDMSTKGVPASTTPAAFDAKATGESKAKTYSGGNIVPGSGRYSLPGQVDDLVKASEKSEDETPDQQSPGWFGRLFNAGDDTLPDGEVEDNDRVSAQAHQDIPPIPPLIDTPKPREGLWVTITPTTMSSSPFFDTLLVLVVSPLVTLTVVYALLLLRARIQRRRWRAPKSVVERLPIRVYHTMSSSSTSTSTHTPSIEASSAASPLLQPEASSTLSRTRPRSRTTTSINETSPLTLERQREDIASRYEKRRYHGKQVECVVCLEEYVDGQSQVMSLPCGHEFHAECITPWLTTRRRTCPICKGDVVRSLAGGSDSGMSDAGAPSQSRDRFSAGSTARTRSESRNSRTRLLGDSDLERGRSGARGASRFSWRTLTRWWAPTREIRRDDSADRDR